MILDIESRNFREASLPVLHLTPHVEFPRREITRCSEMRLLFFSPVRSHSPRPPHIHSLPRSLQACPPSAQLPSSRPIRRPTIRTLAFLVNPAGVSSSA